MNQLRENNFNFKIDSNRAKKKNIQIAIRTRCLFISSCTVFLKKTKASKKKNNRGRVVKKSKEALLFL